jgi:hypothetical protein
MAEQLSKSAANMANANIGGGGQPAAQAIGLQ